MNRNCKKIVLKIIASAFTAGVLLAAMPAAAVAGASLGKPSTPRQPIGPGQPSLMVHQDSLRELEDLTGKSFTASDLSDLQRIVDTVDDLNEELRPNGGHSPQKAKWDLGVMDYQFTVLVCGHLRTDINAIVLDEHKAKLAKIPYFGGQIQEKIINRGNVDLMPCLDPHTGKGYVMIGVGGSNATASLLTAGFSVGVYFAPKTEDIVVGNYVYGRATLSLGGIARWDAVTAGGDLRCAQAVWGTVWEFTIDFSGCRRFFFSSGFSWDLGAKVVSQVKNWWKNAPIKDPIQGNEVNLGVWTFGGGVVVKLREFPWYERMRSGMGLKAIFADIDQYVAKVE